MEIKNIIAKILSLINKKNKKLIILVSITVLILLIFIFVFRRVVIKPRVKEEEKVVKVKVEKIEKENFSQKYPVMGTIKGTIENELRFEIEGVLLKYNYKEGAKIKKDSIIAYIDSKDAMTKVSYTKSKFESEKAAYFSAKKRLNVYKELYELKAISETKLLEAEYEVEAIKQRMQSSLAELELAQSNLLKTNLIAPSNGILAQIIVQPGEFITPQDIVAKFVAIGDVNFEVEVPEKDIQQLKLGMKTKVYCDALPDKVFEGKISEISPIVKEKTRTVVLKIGLPNPDGVLRSGMFARGEIYITELENVVMVLSDSIIRLSQETTLLPILKHTEKNRGVIELRQIKIGSELEKYTVVLDGVYEGELYVVETTGELSDGLLVEYIPPEETSSSKE